MVKTSATNSEIRISVTPGELHNMSLGSTNPIDMPMVSIPTQMDKNTCHYTPYVTDLANQYANPFHTAVRQKANMLHHTTKTETLADTINYCNKQRFIINKSMLECALNEWNSRDEYNLFKGYNIERTAADYPEEKPNTLLAHNTVHYQYKMTLTMAQLYKDTVFYLPVSADFRGCIYVMCNWLSY